jgi:hypothetical protein
MKVFFVGNKNRQKEWMNIIVSSLASSTIIIILFFRNVEIFKQQNYLTMNCLNLVNGTQNK